MRVWADPVGGQPELRSIRIIINLMRDQEEATDPGAVLAELYAKKKRLDVVISALESAVGSRDRGLIERALAHFGKDGRLKPETERRSRRQSKSLAPTSAGFRHARCRAKRTLP